MAKKTNFFKSQSFKYGTVATSLIAVFILLIFGINILVTFLSDKYSLKLDLTGNGLFKLTDQTIQVLDNLDKEIEVVVFSSEENFQAQLNEIVKRFCNQTSKIKLTYVDPDKNPTAVNQYGSQYNIEENGIVVKCSNNIRVINQTDMFSTDSNTNVTTITLELNLVSSVINVTKSTKSKVYFLNANGEKNYESLSSALANAGASVEEINILNIDKFDSDARVMVIANPEFDYSTAQIRKIEDFLKNNNEYDRNLFVFSDASNNETPNLNSLLAEWGIEYQNELVFESSDYSYSNMPTIFFPQYNADGIEDTSIEGNSTLIMRNARPINVLFDSSTAGDITVKSILQTTANAYTKDLSKGAINTYDKEDGDRAGKNTVATISQKNVYIDNNNVKNIVCAISGDMISSDIFASAGNSQFILTIYKDMINDSDETIIDATKYLSNYQMIISDSVSTVINIIILGVIPLILVALGVIVYIRRRYLW